jgi:hypothetical protein
VSLPSLALHVGDLETCIDGYKGEQRGHPLRLDAHTNEDWLATLVKRAGSSSARESAGNRVERLMSTRDLDKPAGFLYTTLSPIGHLGHSDDTDIDLGSGLRVTAGSREARVPVRINFERYVDLRFGEIFARLENPSGDYALDGPFGTHRFWQGKFILVVYQFLHAVKDYVSVNQVDQPYSWRECWFMLCHFVGGMFYQQQIVVYGTMEELLKVVRDSSLTDLRSVGAARPELARSAASACEQGNLIDKVRVRAQTTDKKLPRSAGGGNANGANDNGGGARDTSGLQLCATTGCTYSGPAWTCKHKIVKECGGNFQGGRCTVAHARSGPRSWTCLFANAAKAVLTNEELQRAFGAKESAFMGITPAHAKKDALVAKVAELRAAQ